jgi:hypothetical protein
MEEETMLRKALFSAALGLIALAFVVAGVMAQGTSNQDGELQTPRVNPLVNVQPNMAAASVAQTVPVTLTLTIPGPSGPLTVEVPVYIALDIRIGISPELTPTLAITPSVVTELESENEEEVAQSPTATPTTRATVTPTALPPTPTPVPPEPADDEPADDEPAEVEPTAVPLPTATPTTEPQTLAESPICPDPRAVIASPGVGEVLAGVINILGTATHENFFYYKVEYAPGENVDPNDTFYYLADARVQVTGGLLTSFNTAVLDNGAYTFKLTVVDNSGNFPPPCTVSVRIEN